MPIEVPEGMNAVGPPEGCIACVACPIEFTLRIMDFFNDNQNNILASIDHFQMEDRDEGWEGDDE